MKGWPVPTCLNAFIQLAKQAFYKRPVFQLPFLSLLYKAVSYFSDSKYDIGGFERVLQSVFGSHTMLLGTTYGYPTKIAVTATTTQNLPCIFSNYNGREERPTSCGGSYFESHIV